MYHSLPLSFSLFHSLSLSLSPSFSPSLSLSLFSLTLFLYASVCLSVCFSCHRTEFPSTSHVMSEWENERINGIGQLSNTIGYYPALAGLRGQTVGQLVKQTGIPERDRATKLN